MKSYARKREKSGRMCSFTKNEAWRFDGFNRVINVYNEATFKLKLIRRNACKVIEEVV